MKNYDFQEKLKISNHIKVIMNGFQLVMLAMVIVFQGVWKYAKQMIVDTSYFVD